MTEEIRQKLTGAVIGLQEPVKITKRQRAPTGYS